ncbi:MAG: stalk domain-containing protein, partial [Elusimicrobiota bacterium]
MTALALCSLSGAAAEDLQVVRSGKLVAQVHGYRVDQAVYLGVREIAEVYGGRLSWFSVSRSVALSFHGRKVVFRADEPEAAIGSKKVPLGHPVLLRGKEALVPVDFLTGREFSG